MISLKRRLIEGEEKLNTERKVGCSVNKQVSACYDVYFTSLLRSEATIFTNFSAAFLKVGRGSTAVSNILSSSESLMKVNVDRI